MDCNTAHELLPLYFDGELDRAASREFEEHLDECAECRAALIELDTLRSALRDDAPRYAAPEILRARLQREISGQGASTARRRQSTRWLALAASWVLAFAAGGALMSTWSPEPATGNVQAQITRDLFASHWRALAAASPVDVISTDQHTVKPWFAGKLAVAPLVQDFAAEGYALVGGRVDYVGSDRVPVLVYRHDKHLIDVFVVPQTDALAIGQQVQSQGYVLDAVTLGSQPAVIVSDMGQAELTRFAQLLNSAK
jgi:anti-sigma factor RsiW